MASFVRIIIWLQHTEEKEAMLHEILKVERSKISDFWILLLLIFCYFPSLYIIYICTYETLVLFLWVLIVYIWVVHSEPSVWGTQWSLKFLCVLLLTCHLLLLPKLLGHLILVPKDYFIIFDLDVFSSSKAYMKGWFSELINLMCLANQWNWRTFFTWTRR